MKKGVISIHVDASVIEAAALVVEKKMGTLPVLDDDGKLVGVSGPVAVATSPPPRNPQLASQEVIERNPW